LPLVSREKIADVRDRTNIVEIVKRHVELKRAGTGSWKGLCPFHGEKTPSFHVHEARQFFHCFGCGEKGDVITFLEKIEQRPFMDVLRDLAGLAGVELDERPLSPAERKARQQAESERDRMFRAMELAAAFFEAQYASPAGAAARAYVEGRGIGEAVRARFRIGYAPSRWDALSSHLAAHQIPSSVLEQLGLVGINERGRYDFFRDRVMLPVLDRQKRVIGFGGRLLDPEAKDRKYVNSSDSPLYHKKEQLYGLHAALDPIRRSGVAVVVEGNFDVLALHEAGIENAVAPMGTALTSEQVSTLFVDEDVDGRVARLPTGVDPDDFVRRSDDGPDAFRRLVDSARPMLDQFIQDAASDANVPDRVAALEQIAALLVRVKRPTTRELYAAQLAGVLKMQPAQVRRALHEAAAAQKPARTAEPAGAPVGARPATVSAGVSGPATRLPREEVEVLAVLARNPELLRLPEAARAGDLLLHPVVRQLHRTAIEQVRQEGALDMPSWLDSAAPAERAILSGAMMDDGLAGVADPAGRLRKLTVRLELSRVEAEIDMNGRLQREAQTRGDSAAARALMGRGLELRQTKERLQAELQRP
jgi:DNA primase